MRNHVGKIFLEYFAFAAVFGGGVLLRWYGLDAGLPYVYFTDELAYVGGAFAMVASGDLNPHWFGHPGTPVIYLLSLIYAIGSAFDELTTNELFYQARWLMLAFAAGSMLLTYLIGRRVAGVLCGMLGMLTIAVAPVMVEYARIARPDMLMSVLLLGSTWWVISLAETGRWRDYLTAGFLLGLAVAAKYPALVLAVAIIWAHILNRLAQGQPAWTRLPRLIGSGAATCVGFLAGTPYIVAEYASAWASLIRESRPFQLGVTADGFPESVWWYVAQALPANIGALAILLIVAGAGFAIRKRNVGMSIMLVFAVCLVAFNAALSLRWPRWLIPALPHCALLAAYGLVESYALVRQKIPKLAMVAVPILAAAVVAISLAGPAFYSVQRARALHNADTRSLAATWINENVKPGSAILGELNTAQLPKGRFRLYSIQNGRIAPNNDSSPFFDVPLQYVIPIGALGDLKDIESIDRAQIDYVVLSNEYDRRRAEPLHVDQVGIYAELNTEIDRYEKIMARYALVYEIRPVPGQIAGTTVRIYSTDPTARDSG